MTESVRTGKLMLLNQLRHLACYVFSCQAGRSNPNNL